MEHFLIGHTVNAGCDQNINAGHNLVSASDPRAHRVAAHPQRKPRNSGEFSAMRKHALKFVTLLAILLAAAFLLPQRAAADDDDPPGRVARLSHTDGSVSFEPAGTEDWVSVVINRPLTTGDKLWADKNSRAELQLGNASIRMGSNTGFSFLDLNDNIAQVQLTDGTLHIRVRRLERDEQFEVDTPNLAFSILRPGIYKINVNEAGDTTYIEVRSGEGNVTGGGQSFDVREGESGTFSGTDQLNADMQGLQGDDDFDAWCDERDRREDHSVSGRYVSEDAVGYEDLDDYGGWRDTPDYGTVWFPHTTVVGWAPYRYGHWVYIVPWGYTWVEDEPWGFAPFHYGRWVVAGGVWGWVPCRPAAVDVAYVRPVYAPALVAWVGGPHFAVGVGVGGAATVGWFPLGPREVYVPSYHVSRTYVNNVNITNTTVNTTVINNYYNTNVVNNNTTVNNVKYVNQGVPGAVTAASARSVATAQPISRNIVRVDERQMSSAPVNVRAPSVAPERQAVLGAGRPGAVRPPARIATRTVVARNTPPPPPPRFETQQALIKQNGGQPPALSEVRQKYTNDARQSQVRIAPPARPGTPQTAGNRPNAPENNRPGSAPQNNERPATEQRNNPPQNGQANRPQNNERPANERPNNPPQSEQANRPQNSERPANERPNNPPQNEQANRPQNNERPANPPANANNQPANNQRQYNDRPPAARPANPSPDQSRNVQQLEQQHQQELENMHKQQDQQRQQLEQKQQQERQQLDEQRANQQRQQQLQKQQQQQLQDQQRQHQAQQQQVNQRQQQEHQQQRQQDRPPQQSRPQQQEHSQQARPQQQEKPSKPSKP